MKKTFKLSILCSAACAAALLYPFATFSQIPGLYFRADAGGNITRDTEVKEFFGPVTPGSKVKFDPGARFGFAAGYFFNDWFALEGEVAGMVNNIKSITDATSVDATFSNVPFLVNVRFECPRRCKLSPFIGGGAGVSAAVLDIDHIDHPNAFVHGSDSDAVFAYQGFAGLRYALNDTMGLSLEYRYFATEAPNWNGRHEFSDESIHFGRIETHSVSIAFDFHF